MLWEIRALMKPALSIIDMIPDVHRTAALNTLRRAAFDGKPKVKGLSSEDRDLVYLEGPVQLSSPIGARALRDLYFSGQLKLKKPARKSLPSLDAYVATEGAFREKVAQIEAAHAQAEARLAEIIADPAVATPAELNPLLVSRVLSAHLGYGALGELKIGGLTCHRSLGAPLETDEDARMRAEERVLVWWIDENGARQGDQE